MLFCVTYKHTSIQAYKHKGLLSYKLIVILSYKHIFVFQIFREQILSELVLGVNRQGLLQTVVAMGNKKESG